ncbi:CBS domain-containing protein [Candidatus Woesearchaeota archaeon]|nr:CBS domain-containing protein [Candidatus Woesearchaeota archaeon]
MSKTAYDIARKNIFFCSEEDFLPAVADRMQKYNIGSIIVKSKHGKTTGIVTTGDILRFISRNRDIHEVTARQIMSSPVITVHKDISIPELIKCFKELQTTRLVLTKDNGDYVGVVRDIAAYKYISFVKFDKEAKERFGTSYFNRLY